MIKVNELFNTMMYAVDEVEIYDGCMKLQLRMDPEKFFKEYHDSVVAQFWMYQSEDESGDIEMTLEVMLDDDY